jgi:hypothetical protein
MGALHIDDVHDDQLILRTVEDVFEKPTLEDALALLRINYWRHSFV